MKTPALDILRAKTAALGLSTQHHLEEAFGDYKQVERLRMTPIEFVDSNLYHLTSEVDGLAPTIPPAEQAEARQYMVNRMHDHAEMFGTPENMRHLTAGLPSRQ